MKYDFREEYRVDDNVNVVRNGYTVHGRIVKVTSHCVHVWTPSGKIVCTLNTMGELWVPQEEQEVYIEVID
jgi:hypothetical protein